MSAARLLCCAALLAAGCELFGEEDPTQSNAPRCFAPTLKIGDTCVATYHCPRGTSCFRKACRPLSSDGQECDQRADCAESLLCSCSLKSCSSGGGICHKAGTLADGTACVADKSCSGGVCDPNTGGECGPPLEAGKTCAQHSQCKAGLVCLVAENKCRIRLPKGEACAERQECEKGLVCAGDPGKLRCAEATGVRFERCDFDAKMILQKCGGDLICNLSKGICDYPSDEGGACGGPGSCKGDLECNSGSTPPLCQKANSSEVGQPCRATDLEGRDCKVALICHKGRCAVAGQFPAGEVCREDRECQAGLRCPVDR